MRSFATILQLLLQVAPLFGDSLFNRRPHETRDTGAALHVRIRKLFPLTSSRQRSSGTKPEASDSNSIRDISETPTLAPVQLGEIFAQQNKTDAARGRRRKRRRRKRHQNPTQTTSSSSSSSSSSSPSESSSSSNSSSSSSDSNSSKSSSKGKKKSGKKSSSSSSDDNQRPETEPPTTETPPVGSPSTGSEFETTLELSEVEAKYQQAFIDAATRWDSVIVGDLVDVEVDEETKDDSDCSNLPDSVDDVFICAKIEPIDGAFGILGFAGPEYARFDDNIIPYIGTMQFDTADIDQLVEEGTFESVILHEMGHVYGIGTLWELNELVGAAEDGCPYSLNTAASGEYQALSGCADAAVPIETEGGAGTACVHWDEECLLGELMTGFATGDLELSRITIATLEDLGYTVDYNQADPFPASKLDPSCVCNAAIQDSKQTGKVDEIRSVSSLPWHRQSQGKRRRRKLSEEGREAAREFGLKYLMQKRGIQCHHDDCVYVGDYMISVFYEEAGEIYSVEVVLPRSESGNVFSRNATQSTDWQG